jgi:hypothetical protein
MCTRRHISRSPAVRTGEYARSALGPFGSRLSGPLGCPYPPLLLQNPQAGRPDIFFSHFVLLFVLFVFWRSFLCAIVLAYRVQLGRGARGLQTRLRRGTSAAAHVARRHPGAVCTLWARARSVGYRSEVVRSGEFARLSAYGVEAYGIFKVRFAPELFLFLFLFFLTN